MINKGKSHTIVCIGGMNIDQKLKLKADVNYGTSNPVTSYRSVGGVARNIAENLGRLKENVKFISASGNDADWNEIHQASSPYMDLTYVAQIDGETTGNYTAVINSSGDLVVGFANMDIFNEITPNLLKVNLSVLLKANCIVIDLNCPHETIRFILGFAEKHTIPLVIIPVSSPKMDRLPENLQSVNWLIVNKDESETFLHMTINNKQEWEIAVKKWLSYGVQNVIVTNGSQGVMVGGATTNYDILFFSAIYTPKVVDVTGAGDAFCAAIIHSWLQNEHINSIIKAGMINAHKTIMSPYTVRQNLTRKKLQEDIQKIENMD